MTRIAGKPGTWLLPAVLAVLVLAGCQRQQAVLRSVPRLVLAVSPASPARLEPGSLVRVTALPVPWVDLAWVSGTVGVLGAPTAAFRRGPDGVWSFRTMVPPMVLVPAGAYRVKAWGRAVDGEEVRGTLTYEVE